MEGKGDDPEDVKILYLRNWNGGRLLGRDVGRPGKGWKKGGGEAQTIASPVSSRGAVYIFPA